MPDQIKESETKKTLHYLALGDSYTIGEKVRKDESFPAQTAGLLQHQGFSVAPPRIIARTGWTTGELQAALAKARLRKRYDFVTLLIGVNNQYRGLSSETYRPEFEQLLHHALALTGNAPAKVLVLSIPDWGVTPFAEGRNREKIATEIDAFNEVNRRMAEQSGVPYLDITRATRRAALEPDLLAEDGLHPSGKVYAEWAGEVCRYMAESAGK